jgi:hypothetical protein
VAGTYSTGFLSPERLEALSEASRNDTIVTIAAAIAKYEADTKPARSNQTGKGASAWKLAGRPR